jgi:hypothetical protein
VSDDLEFREVDQGTELFWQGERAGALRTREDTAVAEFLAAVPPEACVALLDALRERGLATLISNTLLLRHEARRRGWSGELRGALHFDGTAPRSFLDELQVLLPGVEVALAPHRSLFKKVWASAMSGVTGMTRVRATPTGGRALVVSLPDRDDLVAETVAIAIDTAFAIHRRFGVAATYVDSISFDHAQHGMAEGRVGGAAPQIRGEVHVNANYAVASTVGRTWTSQLEGTVAHEFWHKIEMGWESTHYAETVEFRRAVGALFGMPTIEQVMFDDAARERLVAAVTPYAATGRLEATAELFKLLWTHKPEDNLVVEAFGEIVDRFLPPPTYSDGSTRR